MTRNEAMRAAARRLEAAGVEDALHDARRLMEKACALTPAGLIAGADAVLEGAEQACFEALAARRAAREPLTQILESAGFWTLELRVTPDVLSPRADTETLVQAALDMIRDRAAPLQILDIATGSGAILLALLSECPMARGTGTDLSAAALAIARENAGRCGLADRARFVQACWAQGVGGRFDLLTCNPPYIDSAVLETLEPEVRDFEPRMALDGGPGGLAPYRGLLETARALLKPGAPALFEIGYDQGAPVLALAREAGAAHARIVRDGGGRDRVLIVRFE